MKILCVSHYYPPHVGGLEVVAKKQAESLANFGHSVSVITCASRGEAPGVEAKSGVTVYRLRALNIFDTQFGLPFPIAGISLFTHIWKEVAHADVVQVHDIFYQTSWVAYLCTRIQKKPLFLTQHVAFVEHTSTFVTWVEHMLYATWGTLIFKYARSIVVYNDTVKTFLNKRGFAHKVHELRNGVDLSLFRPGSPEEKREARCAFNLPLEKPLVLFVGRFVPKKGVDEMFSARDSSYDVVFAGSGEIKNEWRVDGVHWVGALPQEKLAILYRAADIFVCPARGELFTLAMQEACASALPIVTTDDPAYQKYELDREQILFVEPKAPAIKKVLQSLVSDNARRVHMGAYAFKLAQQKFNWDTNIEHLLTLYNVQTNQTQPVVVTTSWDDGHILDLKLGLRLRAHGVTGTFFIAPEDRELSLDKRLGKEGVIELSKNFEIGAHTLTHPYLPHVDEKTAREEIQASKKVLETWLSRPITSFCYPKGGYTPAHEELAREAGFTRARTTRRFSLTSGTNAYALPTTIHTYDHWLDIWPLALFVRFNPFKFLSLYHRWDKQAIALFDRTLKTGGVFHLWGHSWEIEEHNDWDRLERVLTHIGNRSDVRYVPVGEL